MSAEAMGWTWLLLVLGAAAGLGQQSDSSTAVSPKDGSAAQAKVFDVGPELTAPELLPAQWAIESTEGCKQKHEGDVLLSLVVDANGAPGDIKIHDAQYTPEERLALRVVAADSFKPGTLRGEAVAVRQWVEVTIHGCLAKSVDKDGKAIDVYRLAAQPEQRIRTPPGLGDPDAGDGSKKLNLERVGGKVFPPVPLNSVQAEFTDDARRRRIQGICLISVIVDGQGKPQNPRVIRSLEPGLDQKAIEAVNKYRFKPAMKEGVPVAVMITVEVNFRL